MEADTTNAVSSADAPRKRFWRGLLLFGSILIAAIIMLAAYLAIVPRKSLPPVQVTLNDGRILQIEGVTYGTHHRMGKGSDFLDRLSKKFPPKLKKFLGVDYFVSTVDQARPGLVVWVNVIDPLRTNTARIPVFTQLIDKNGEIFSAPPGRRFSSGGLWREAHVFDNYPRDEPMLKLQAMSLHMMPGPRGSQANQTATIEFANPHVVQPAKWTGAPLPQSKTVDGLEIVLNGLRLQQTSTGSMFPFAGLESGMHQAFFAIAECRQQGKPATGWSWPQWMIEDPLGNQSWQGSIHQPVLKFLATVYPEATNTQDARLMAILPQLDLSVPNTNLWWNQKGSLASNEIVALGLFLPGKHTFSNGVYESSSSVVTLSRTTTGKTWREQIIPPIGWKWNTRTTAVGGRVSLFHDHFATNLVIFIRASKLISPNRIGVRLRDDFGRYWIAKADPIPTDRVQAFFVELPPGVTNVVPEVVLLKPVQAEFLVDTKNYLKQESPPFQRYFAEQQPFPRQTPPRMLKLDDYRISRTNFFRSSTIDISKP